MKHIDITFDFETCSVAPDAAPMQLAAIVWNRDAKGEHPFTEDTFNVGIDLRTCITAGFSFDQDTIDWWSRQNEQAKRSVTDDECYAVNMAFMQFCEWIGQMKLKYGADTVCLWCQGQDFDFPILKTIAKKFSLKMPVHQHYFRDCRTYVLEAALTLAQRKTAAHDGDMQTGTSVEKPDAHATGTVAGGALPTIDEIMAKPMRAYDIIPKITSQWIEGRTQHDAIYDCLRSTWSVWHCMKLLQ